MLNSHRDPAGDATRTGDTGDRSVTSSARDDTADSVRTDVPSGPVLPVSFPVSAGPIGARPATAGLIRRTLRLDIPVAVAGVMTTATFAELVGSGWPDDVEHRTLACCALVFALRTGWRTARALWRRCGPEEIQVSVRFRPPRP
ncbi:hypothetical protein NONI108955_19680 [Nocardia ninae]|uniref:Uncharacterized protein n=1 Tax=Nocardia ninae NBRC 108245 TaxID=1210091 RepID=A0A511MA69_9NOCA|nr:hypothetical protein [Nocardia ninae]GEM36636.1 hypothetical protein NN4_11550 [Nocardia ninae NBRC 108245]